MANLYSAALGREFKLVPHKMNKQEQTCLLCALNVCKMLLNSNTSHPLSCLLFQRQPKKWEDYTVSMNYQTGLTNDFWAYSIQAFCKSSSQYLSPKLNNIIFCVTVGTLGYNYRLILGVNALDMTI